LDFLLRWGVTKQGVDVQDLITNEFIDQINKFDAYKIVAEAKNYTPKQGSYDQSAGASGVHESELILGGWSATRKAN
jgi:hypothetical protein